jgi:hypothetical protein
MAHCGVMFTRVFVVVVMMLVVASAGFDRKAWCRANTKLKRLREKRVLDGSCNVLSTERSVGDGQAGGPRGGSRRLTVIGLHAAMLSVDDVERRVTPFRLEEPWNLVIAANYTFLGFGSGVLKKNLSYYVHSESGKWPSRVRGGFYVPYFTVYVVTSSRR